MCGLAIGGVSDGAIAACVYVCVLVVMWQGRGLGDNHRFEEGPHSELTHLIEPLGKNKAGAMGRGGGAERGVGGPVHQQPWEWNLPRTQMTNWTISGARAA